MLFDPEHDLIALGDSEGFADLFGDGDLTLRCDLGCDVHIIPYYETNVRIHVRGQESTLVPTRPLSTPVKPKFESAAHAAIEYVLASGAGRVVRVCVGPPTLELVFASTDIEVAMTMIVVMPESTLPLAEIKKRLSEIVDRVETYHERVVLTRNGRPAAVIVSPDDLEGMEETLDILSEPGALEGIRRAEDEIKRGEYVSGEELRVKYLAR